ncbi:transporter [Martelella soudanensis]|uniref:transporter n=1 Tax=unclassified Martelella TaxID=2629616 RepID=UPI0015DE4689|nr:MULTISPECIES: transporter [unclassified Martelella]
MKRFYRGIFSTLGVFAMTASAHAIDISPGDYTLLPANTKVALEYFQYTNMDSFELDGAGKVPDSGFDNITGVSRFLYYGEAGTLRYGLQAYLPYGTFSDAHIGGMDAPVTNGIADFTVGATAWLVKPDNPAVGTTLALTGFLTLPTGDYDPSRIGLGGGTTVITPQIGLIQALGGGLYFDGAFDTAFAFDHDEDGVDYSRDPSAQLQAYLRYQPSAKASVSFGYSGKFGGKSYANGTYTQQMTRQDSLRLFANTFITPTVQIEAMLSMDVNVNGGFKGTTGQLRLMKLF